MGPTSQLSCSIHPVPSSTTKQVTNTFSFFIFFHLLPPFSLSSPQPDPLRHFTSSGRRLKFTMTQPIGSHLKWKSTAQSNPSAMKKPSSRDYDSSPASAAAAAAAAESPHSPLRFHSPLRSDLGDPPETPPYASPAASPERTRPSFSKPPTVDRYTQCSLIPSPSPSPDGWRTHGDAEFSAKDPPPVTVLSRAVRQEGMPALTKSQDRRPAPATAVLRRSVSWVALQRVALGFRVCEFVFCLIAFSVMAADKTQGWSGDSFDRYKEYRYCLAINVIAFVYSGFQACDLAYQLMTGKPIILHHLHSYFDFFMDQVLAYLLISASSSAATRVDDWQSNWGKDKFTEMASASVSMSFLAFVAFAISSLISGYFLFTHDVA